MYPISDGRTIFAYIGGWSAWIGYPHLRPIVNGGSYVGRGVCVYISADVGRLYVAYPYEGAMREPEQRDKRGGTYSHVFFVSIRFGCFSEWHVMYPALGVCRVAPLCAY